MKIKIATFSFISVIISIVAAGLYFFLKMPIFIILVILANLVFGAAVFIIHFSMKTFLKVAEKDFHKIPYRKQSYFFQEFNLLINTIKSFFAERNIFEAFTLTLSKNSDSDVFFKVLSENMGIILKTPHIAVVLYDPVIEKYEFQYGNGAFSNGRSFTDLTILDKYSDYNLISKEDLVVLTNNEICSKISASAVLVLNSSLNYRGYIILGFENADVLLSYFDRYDFFFLEINTIFNSHINNKKLKEKINELNLLNKIVTFMEKTRDLDAVLHLFMTHITVKEGLSFNRVVFFRKENNILNGVTGLGPLTPAEADMKWNQIKSTPVDFFLEKSNEETTTLEPIEQLTQNTSIQITNDPVLNEIILLKKHKVISIDNCNLSTENIKIFKSFNLKTFIIAPLFSYDNCIGIIIADNAFDLKAFSEERINSLLNFTSQTALVINNLMLYNKIKNMAIKDDLTKLYNRRFFEEQLLVEIDRATRHESHLSLIMIDIDHFKMYNDRNGHIAGDTLLTTIASIFRDVCRASDYVCRYGGEEFSIILPQTDIIGAYEVAEKVRRKIFENTFPLAEYQPGHRLSISLGVSTYPVLSKNKIELKENADQALYHSKKIGRNRVTIYSKDIIK